MSRPTLIIPIHNRRETTLNCLRHLRVNGDLANLDAIVVDDGSTDGSEQAVRAEFPEVQILRGNGELWWTGAVALGMQHAFFNGAEAVCWLNDDCLPAAGTLRRLTEACLASPEKVVAPACFDATTGEPVSNAFIGRKRVAPGPATCAADGLSGFCVALPRAVWMKIGLPDARHFPHYYGDNAYTLLARRAGFPVLVLGEGRAELTAFHAPPALRTLSDPAGGRRNNWRRIFISPKSPYRLRTLFAYQRLKYGWLPGTLMAAWRSLGWIAVSLGPTGRG
jgi:GT2 family glycosyltransferase